MEKLFDKTVNVFELKKDSINCRAGTIFTQPNKLVYVGDQKCRDVYWGIASPQGSS